MRRLPLLLSHPLAGPGLRYVVAGAIVALVYLGVPVLLNVVIGLPVEAAIPIAYVLAISLHFTLQRTFVFHHVEEFALSTRGQIKRYCMIAAVQYPTTAVATAILPGVLHLPQRDTYVLVTLTTSVISFTVLRTLIFHGDNDDHLLVGAEASSAADLEIAQEQLLHQGGVPEGQPDSVQAGMH
jgi:putative flippase GtrA